LRQRMGPSKGEFLDLVFSAQSSLEDSRHLTAVAEVEWD